MLLRKWDMVAEIVRILYIPYQATILMQKESYTLTDFYGCWRLMLVKLEKISHMENNTALAQNLLAKMAQREHQFFANPAIVCALALDPRFCGSLTAQQENTAQSELAKLWRRLKNYNAAASFVESDDDMDKTIEDTTLLMKLLGRATQPTIDLPSIITAFIRTNHNFEPVLNFWNTNKSKYPELYQLAEIIFAISPTQAVVERSFSTLSYVFNSRRNQLSEKTLENILLATLNKDLFHAVNEDDRNEINSAQC